ncbi:hypothetical protein SARC_15829, partial [Sphaeroforma arctica JP610]
MCSVFVLSVSSLANSLRRTDSSCSPFITVRGVAGEMSVCVCVFLEGGLGSVVALYVCIVGVGEGFAAVGGLLVLVSWCRTSLGFLLLPEARANGMSCTVNEACSGAAVVYYSNGLPHHSQGLAQLAKHMLDL